MKLSTDTEYDPRHRCMFGYEQPPRRQGWHRVFCCYFFFVGWDCMSLGIHVAVMLPNIELHVPFGFFRVGWVMRSSRDGGDYASYV